MSSGEAVEATQISVEPTPPETIAAEAGKVLASYGADGTGHVFNLGHGISQFTPPENVTVLVNTVHEHSRALRAQAA